MKKHKKLKIFVAIVLVLVIIFSIWWITPKTFPTLSAQNVEKIKCFNGTTGQTVMIENREDIEYIVSQLKSTKYNVDSIALRLGTMFNLTFYYKNGFEEFFILDVGGEIRQDPFFYSPKEGDAPLELFYYFEDLNGFEYRDSLREQGLLG